MSPPAPLPPVPLVDCVDPGGTPPITPPSIGGGFPLDEQARTKLALANHAAHDGHRQRMAQKSAVAPVVPKATRSIVNGRSIPWLRTRPESGTAGWRHESARLRQGPHCASARAR
jgi:hypothetical protein